MTVAIKHGVDVWVQRLQEERVSLTQRQDSFRQLLEEMSQKYEELNGKLQENETHAQVRVSHAHRHTQSLFKRQLFCFLKLALTGSHSWLPLTSCFL